MIIRSTTEEKEYAIASRMAFQTRNATFKSALASLQKTALEHGNVFKALMEVARSCSLGQMSGALYEVGGQYRRNM